MTEINGTLPAWPGLQAAMDDVRTYGARTGLEAMIVLRPDGTRLAELSGDEHQVTLSEEKRHAAAGCLVVHDHPKFGELSINDLAFATNAKLAGIIATLPDGSWSYAKGIKTLPHSADMFFYHTFGSIGPHPWFKAADASNQIFGDLEHGDPRFFEKMPLANRSALLTLEKYGELVDYRLNLLPEAQQVFKGLPGLKFE